MARSPLRPGHCHPPRPARRPAGSPWRSRHARPAGPPQRTLRARSRGRRPQDPARGQGPDVGQGSARTRRRILHPLGGAIRGRPRAPVPVRPSPARRASTPVGRALAAWQRSRCAERPPPRPAARSRRWDTGQRRAGRRQPFNPDATPTGLGAGGRSRTRSRRSRLGAAGASGRLLGRFRSWTAVALPPPHRPPRRSPTRALGPRASRRRPIGVQPGVRTSTHPTRGGPVAPLPAPGLANPTHRVPNGPGRAQSASRTTPNPSPHPTCRGQAGPTRRGEADAVDRGQAGAAGRGEARGAGRGKARGGGRGQASGAGREQARAGGRGEARGG
jgi:hypothetical protein